MSEQTARLMRPERRKPLSWVPVAALTLSIVLAAGSAVLTWGTFKGRTEARDEAIAANQAATAALIKSTEDRLTKAVERMEAQAERTENRLASKVDAIDDKVESIRSATTQQLAEVRADLRASEQDRQRLWQELGTESLKRERLERQLSAAGFKPGPGPN